MRNSSKALMMILGVGLLFLSSCGKDTPIPLWEISKENSPKSYLVGTIQYLEKPKGESMITSLLSEVFNNSDTYITQSNIKESDLILTKRILEIGMNRSLKDVLLKEDFNKLSIMKNDWDKAIENNVEAPDSMRMKLIFYLQEIIFYNNQGSFFFDQYWEKQAMPMKKNITGLETWQDGFQSLAEVPFEDQIKFMNSISDFEEYRRQLRSQTQEFYLDSNYTLLKSFYDEKFPFMVDYKETLVAKKHKDWAEKLSAGMDTSSCFISLDVTHLVGEDNLIDKLLSKGYKVSKIQ